MTATKQSLPQQSDCVVYFQWLPPVNWNKTSISKYRVTVEYASSQSDTSTSLSLSANMVVKNCSIDAVIRVGAVDVCEREGLATNDSLADVLTSSSPVTTSTTPDQPHSSGLRTEGECTYRLGKREGGGEGGGEREGGEREGGERGGRGEREREGERERGRKRERERESELERESSIRSENSR